MIRVFFSGVVVCTVCLGLYRFFLTYVCTVLFCTFCMYHSVLRYSILHSAYSIPAYYLPPSQMLRAHCDATDAEIAAAIDFYRRAGAKGVHFLIHKLKRCMNGKGKCPMFPMMGCPMMGCPMKGGGCGWVGKGDGVGGCGWKGVWGGEERIVSLGIRLCLLKAK